MVQPALSPVESYQEYVVGSIFAYWTPRLLEHAQARPGERVLDVACGTGIVARSVAPLVGAQGQVVAVDYNPAMLAMARTIPAPAGAAIEWREGDAADLPDCCFDLVTCQQGLQFFPDRAAAVREMRRVLAPGGRAVVAVWQGLEVHPVFRLLGEAIASHQSVPVERLMRAFALGDAGALHRLFDAAGFSGVEVFTETADVHFRPPERLVQMQVQGGAAVLPEFERMTDGERVALIAAVTESLGDAFDGYLRDGELVMPMYAHIVVASEEGESELYQDAGVG